MSRFTYARLIEDRIRLLKLRPGSWNDDLEADLFEANQSFHYIALSYTWGSPIARKEVIVNGSVKRITVNLDHALRTLRSPDEPITLWVDALSIDQDDVNDKNQQVNLMHQIFSWADEVRAYIGNSIDKSQRNRESRLEMIAASDPFRFPEANNMAWEHIHSALSLLESKDPASLSPHERCLCIFGLLRALSCEELHAKLSGMNLFSSNQTDKMEPKFRHLFEWLRLFVTSPWWDRMWITQEVGVARSLSLVYGKVTVPFQMLSEVTTELAARPFNSPSTGREHTKVLELLISKVKKVSELRRFERFRSIAEIRDLGYFQRSLGSPLLWLLRTFRHKRSSEPRDKIYALSQLLGKLGTPSESRFKTDYNISVTVLFSKFVFRLIHETGLFWITSPDLLAKSRDNLPSWVPNWADGFSSGELSDMGWKMRLCHNASNITFTIKVSDATREKMNPFEYYRSLSKKEPSSSWEKLRGSQYEHDEEFSGSTTSEQKFYVTNQFFHLDHQDTEARRIQYSHYRQSVRDITKVENCLKIPAQYCTTIHYVSEPITTGITNLSSIVDGLKLAKKEIFPNDWDYDLIGKKLNIIGRVICFGVVVEGPEKVRIQGGWDDPNLGILVHLLMAGRGSSLGADPANQEDYEKCYRDKFISEVMGECDSCSNSDERPCQDCERIASEKEIPLAADARQDKKYKQILKTALHAAPGNCIVLNRDGTMALCPPRTEVGDDIFILSGGLCPYVLRRDKSPKYLGHRALNLVGDCFLSSLPAWDPDRLETLALV